MKDEALDLALEALENLFGIPAQWTGEGGGDVAVWRLGGSHRAQAAITAIKQARSAPVQEPVAWMHWLHGPVQLFMNKQEAMMELDRLNREYPVDNHARKMRPLVFGDATPPIVAAPLAAQRQWVGLTDDDFHAICTNFRVAYGGWVNMLALEIEAKLKEKNT
jgi:hypothetical protein